MATTEQINEARKSMGLPPLPSEGEPQSPAGNPVQTQRSIELENTARESMGAEPLPPPVPPPAPRPQTTGEYVRDTGHAIGAGLSRIIPGLMDTPQVVLNAADLAGNFLAKKIRGQDYELPFKSSDVLGALTGTLPFIGQVRDRPTSYTEDLGQATNGLSDFRGNDLTQKILGTGAEFIGPGIMKGPGLIGKGVKLATQALLPAAASEGAGELAREYAPNYETAAKIVGALVGGGLGAGVESAVSPNFGRGMPGVDTLTDTKSASERLRDRGFKVSAGQQFGDKGVIARESGASGAQALNVHNQRIYNREVMKSIGSSDQLVNPETLKNAREAIGNGYDEILQGTSIIFTGKQGQKVSDALDQYTKGVSSLTSKLPEGVREIADNIIDLSRTGGTLDAQNLWQIRSELGKRAANASASKDFNESTLIGNMRAAIDDAIDETMAANFRFKDSAKLADLNEKYRNLLAVEAAHTIGLTSPFKSISQAGYINSDILDNVIKDQDAGYYLRPSKPRDLADLNNDMTTTKILQPQGSMLSPDSVVSKKGGIGTVAATALPVIGGVGGLGSAIYAPQLLNTALANPVMSTAALALGTLPVAGISAKNALERNALNPIVQAYMRNQLVNPSKPLASMGAAALKAERASRDPSDIVRGGADGFKSGGRVVSHDAEADRLVMAAERAKRGLSAHTEGLLNTSDDAVASALEIANRSI